MKSIFVATLCLVLLAVVLAQRPRPPPRTGSEPTGSPPPRPTRRPRPPKPTKCDSAEDCDADSCCVTGPLGLRGLCSKLGGEGRRCSSDPEIVEGRYKYRCPCAEGLSCVPRQIVTNKLGEIIKVRERCTSSTASPEPEPESTTELVTE